MKQFEEEAFSKVLANEVTCRVLVNQLIKRGVTFSVNPDELKHEDLVEAVLAIYSELARNEAKPATQGDGA